MNAPAQLNRHWLAARLGQTASESISWARLARFLSDPGKSAPSPLQDWCWKQLPRAGQRGDSRDMAFPSNCQWAPLNGKAA